MPRLPACLPMSLTLPWMLMFEKGKSVGDVTVSGPRRQITEAVVNLVWQRQEGPSIEVSSAEDAVRRINANRKAMHMVGVVGLFAEEDRGSEVAECYLRVAAMLRDQVLFMHSFDAELRHSSAWPLPRTKKPYPLGSIAVIKAEPFRSKYEPSALITPLYEALADAKAQGVSNEDRDNSLRDWMFQGVAPLVGHMTGNAPPSLAPAFAAAAN